MQKFDFEYQMHELDVKRSRSIYEDSYESAIASFIDWIHHNGFIGYFDEKTVIGNPNNRNKAIYTEDLTHSCMEVYLIQYILVNHYTHDGAPSEEKKIQLFMGDDIGNFLDMVRSLKEQTNVKNLTTYKGLLNQFKV